MMRPMIAGLAGVLMLAGCATLRNSDRADELAGQTLRTRTTRGQVSTLTFHDDGTVRAAFSGRSVTGRWRLRGGDLCFYWGDAPRECWPYPAPFERGRTRTVTSDRGNVLQVTRQ